MSLQADEAEDWVIVIGKTTLLRDFVRMICAKIQIKFKGAGVEEKGYVKACKNHYYKIAIGKEVVSVDPKYFRHTEVDLLIGDPTKARSKLG